VAFQLNRSCPTTVWETNAAQEAFKGALVLSKDRFLSAPRAGLVHFADTLIVQLDGIWDMHTRRLTLGIHGPDHAGSTNISFRLNR
jgi:hypothetical protein